MKRWRTRLVALLAAAMVMLILASPAMAQVNIPQVKRPRLNNQVTQVNRPAQVNAGNLIGVNANALNNVAVVLNRVQVLTFRNVLNNNVAVNANVLGGTNVVVFR